MSAELNLSKHNLGMINAAAVAAGLHGQGKDDFIAAVQDELVRNGDPLARGKSGHRDFSAPHVASAISTVVGRVK